MSVGALGGISLIILIPCLLAGIALLVLSFVVLIKLNTLLDLKIQYFRNHPGP